MNQIHAFLLGSALLVVSLVAEEGPYEPDVKWEEHQLEKLDVIPEAPSSDDMLLLVRLASTRTASNIHAQSVAEKAWQRLSSIPDFPDRLLSRIHEERDKWKAGGWSGGYDRERMWTIQPMAKIAHPGIVRVLGELLADLEATSEKLSDAPVVPNGVLAADALGELVETPPVKKRWDAYTEDDVATWQLWYEQVKAGNRTFRFKGDPQEYNLEGPVSSSVNPVERRSAGSGHPNSTSGEQSEGRSISVAGLVAACGALGWAVFAFWRGRQRNVA